MRDTRPAPPLTHDQVMVTVHADGSEVIIVPDEIARRIERERKNGWREFHGQSIGESRPFPAGTWMYDTLTTLIGAYGNSPIPDGLAARDWQWALAGRWQAMDSCPQLSVSIAGASDWNPDTRTWNNFAAHADLHPFGAVHRIPGEDAYRLAG